MRCERLTITLLLLVTLACSRETPAPPQTVTTATTTTTAAVATDPSAVSTAAGAPPRSASTPHPSYDEAMNWFRSSDGFRFALQEGDVRAEGQMSRETVGKEQVTFRAGSEEWRASAGPQGVTWERRSGSAWVPTAAPPFGNRVYQRVTLAFDPQKKEGAPQLIEGEPGETHYRFTDANSGNVHDVWVSADGQVKRIRIGATVDLQINP